MNGNHIGVSVKGEMIAGIQLLAPHGAHFAVHQHIAFLDNSLGHTAGLHGVSILEVRIQLNKLRSDIDGNGMISLLNNYFHSSLRSIL